MPKTEVYSWRLSPALKAALEDVARARGMSLSALLERAARDWLLGNAPDDRDAEEERARARAMRFVGKLSGATPDRAADAPRRIRARLRRRHGG
jgi:hypothetical protein